MTHPELTGEERRELLAAWRITRAVYAEIAHDPDTPEMVRDTYHGRMATLAHVVQKLALPMPADTHE